MKAYLAVLQTRVQEDFTYRWNYLVAAFFRFLPLVTTIFLWQAVFASMQAAGKKPQIAGFTYEQTVAYYLLVYVARGFSSMPRMSREVCQDIRDGLLNRYLVKPIGYFGYQAAYRLAHKLVFWAVALVAFPPVFYALRGCFSGLPDTAGWLVFFYTLFLAFLIGLLFNFLIGILAFWFLEISTFLYVIMTVEYFLSGHLIPLTFLPQAMREICLFLPFAYEAYWPVAVFLGIVEETYLFPMLFWGTLWVGVLGLLCAVLWHLGIHRYAAVGG